VYTTYHARGYDIYPHGPDYLPYLGEYIIYDPPGDPPPYLWTNYEEDPDDRYERVYYFIVTPRPYLSIEEAPIAWTKTVNFFTDPENWWLWNYDEYYFYLNEGLLPGFLLPIFNNFPHPQGYIYGHPPGWPDWWPGDHSDHRHVDWCFHERWPDELPTDPPAYGHDAMTLHMIIDDWGTFDEMWEAYILDRGRWVQ
jgi:hypothetical protein